MTPDRGLTDKEKALAHRILVTNNPRQSALDVGYSESYAKSNVYQTMKKPAFTSFMKDIANQMNYDNNVATELEVLEYLTSVMRGEVTEETLYNVGNYQQEVIDLGVGVKDRTQAAKLLGKHFGLYKDKVDMMMEIPTIIEGEDDLE